MLTVNTVGSRPVGLQLAAMVGQVDVVAHVLVTAQQQRMRVQAVLSRRVVALQSLVTVSKNRRIHKLAYLTHQHIVVVK